MENGALLEALAILVEERCGFRYIVAHLDSNDGRGIDTAVLSDPRRTAVQNVALRQTCVTLAASAGQGSCPAGQSWLYSRPPLEAELLVDGRPLVVWVNHFKSKRGGEEDSEPERLAQAEHQAQLAAERLAADPEAALVVLGDFNDYALSPPMLRLAEQSGLTNILTQLPLEEQYTFVFSGVSQMIDGILLSPSLLPRVAHVQILHINADYPDQYGSDISPEFLPYKSADHDPALVILNWTAEASPLTTTASTPSTPPPPWLYAAGGFVAALLLVGTLVLWHKRSTAS